jgi:hypothetical protein
MRNRQKVNNQAEDESDAEILAYMLFDKLPKALRFAIATHIFADHLAIVCDDPTEEAARLCVFDKRILARAKVLRQECAQYHNKKAEEGATHDDARQ